MNEYKRPVHADVSTSYSVQFETFEQEEANAALPGANVVTASYALILPQGARIPEKIIAGPLQLRLVRVEEQE